MVFALRAVIVPRLTPVELKTVWPTAMPEVLACGTTVTPAATVPFTASAILTLFEALLTPRTPMPIWKAPVVS